MKGKPPWIWARIVKACAGPSEEASLLSVTEKLVYLEVMGLCVGRAYMTYGVGSIARRLGLSTRTIRRAIATLEDVDLLDSKDRGEGRSAARYPTMPVFCRPKARRLDEDQLEEWANKLAHHITRKRAQTPDTNDTGESKTPIQEAV